jgi:hypothetical protein
MYINERRKMVFKKKSLDEKVQEFKFTFGKNEGKKLDEVDADYIDWILREYKYLSEWDRKVLNRYLHIRAEEINAQENKLREEVNEQNDNFTEWVDENF